MSLYPRTAVDFADFVVRGGIQARDFESLACHHQQLIWRSGRDDMAFIYSDRDRIPEVQVMKELYGSSKYGFSQPLHYISGSEFHPFEAGPAEELFLISYLVPL